MSSCLDDGTGCVTAGVLVLVRCFSDVEYFRSSTSPRLCRLLPFEYLDALLRCCGGVPAGESFSFPFEADLASSSTPVFAPCHVSTILQGGLFIATRFGRDLRKDGRAVRSRAL